MHFEQERMKLEIQDIKAKVENRVDELLNEIQVVKGNL